MATNDITGDRLVSRSNSSSYTCNYDRIFSRPDFDSGEDEANEDTEPKDAERPDSEDGEE